MKSFLVVLIFLSTAVSFAQTTEDFETETNGSTTFSDNGQTFNITSQVGGPFKINALSPGTGWNGIAADGRYIDNSGSVNGLPVQFTINSEIPIIVNNFWLYLTDNSYNLNAIGSVTITGKLAGKTVYTVTQSSGFNTTVAVNKGFSLIDLSTFGSANNSNQIVDQIIITTGGNFYYVALDAFNWVNKISSEDFETETNGSTTFSDHGQTFTITSQSGGNFKINALSPGTGWNGTAADSRYVDNNGSSGSSEPMQFTIHSGDPFIVNNFWLYLAAKPVNAPGAVTIIGTLRGRQLFSVTKSSGFNNNIAINNGFSFIDLSTIFTWNLSNIVVDHFTIIIGSSFSYAALDAFNWSIPEKHPQSKNSIEDFETETNGSTTFSDNGRTFGITSQAGGTFKINDLSPGTGWNGTAADSRYLDNSDSVSGIPVQFTINSAEPFIVNNFWLYLLADESGIVGSVTITGKLKGATVYSATQHSAFNTNLSINNGFSLINLSNFGLQNNSNKVVDEITICTGGNFSYVAMDALNWTIPEKYKVPKSSSIYFETEPGGSTNIAENGQTFFITSQAGGIFKIDTQYYLRGWNGITADRRFLANEYSNRSSVQFTINSEAPFIVNNFWLLLSDNFSNLKAIGSVTITGKLEGDTVFTATQSSGFNTTISKNNGYSLIDLSSFGSQNNSNQEVDEIIITTGGNFFYVALDAFNWSKAFPEINIKDKNISINDGDATPSATDETDFGSQSVCSGTIVRTFTIQNSGTINLNISSVNINGATAADYQITTVPAAIVAASDSTTFQVTFHPSALGARNATITVNSNDSDKAAFDFSITGTGDSDDVDVNTSLTSSTITANNINPGVTYKWLNCATNTLISDETNQTYPVTANGNYAVIITEGECSDTSACVPVFILGENESLNEDLFKIYPNPNTGSFTLFNTMDVDVKITDALSKVVYNNHFDKGQQEIDLKQDMGIYFIHYTHNGQTFTRKMVINK